jgi:hypothetical protein
MSLLHDDLCALYAPMPETDVKMFRSIRAHWMAEEMAFSTYSDISPSFVQPNLSQLEFTNVNFAICASTFETLLLIGTFPEKPIVRLCAMPSATMCYYLGTLFLATAFLTQKGYHLPFPMSSTPKGALWRPALLAILEDSGAIEARGELAHREAVMKRYEASPSFRRMMLRLTWFWGISLMIIAIVTTVLIVSLEERVAFGVGWGLPYVWSGLFGIWTVRFVKKSLKEERAAWQTGTYSGVRI